MRLGGPRFGFMGRGVFLNHASVSPPCRAARQAVADALEGIPREDDKHVHSRATSARAREAFARFVGTKKSRVMGFLNTSEILSRVAWGLKWRRGDEVLVSRNEFVSNFLAWELQRGRGVRTRFLRTHDERVDAGDLRRAITKRTRVVAVSAVHWATGARQDLRALADVAHEHDAFLVVDAAQSLGARPHSSRKEGYDLLATNSYKWLVSFNGAGFAEFSPALLDAIEPPAVGWLSVAGDPEPEVVTGGRPRYRLGDGIERLAGGAPSALSNLAVAAAMDDLSEYGQGRIEREVLASSSAVMDAAASLGVPAVTPEEPGQRAGIVGLKVRRAADAAASLRRLGVRAGARGGFLRISPHFYTTGDDVERFTRALRRIL